MAAPRVTAAKRRVDFNEESLSDPEDPYATDDSREDKDYVESDHSSLSDSTSEKENEENECETSRGFLETPEKHGPSRWRVNNLENRIRVKAKNRRNLGHGYVTAKKKPTQPRTMGPPCQCSKKCRELLDGEEDNIFHAFWDLGSFDKQNAYLFGTIQGIPKQRTYKKKVKREHSSRSVTYKYFIKIKGIDQLVCKEEFLSVHGLQKSVKRVNNICKQIKEGRATPKSDSRGRHKNRKRLPEEMINSVHTHIKCIPKYSSHYSRKHNPNRVYIDHDLSISSLYKKYYISWCTERNLTPVKEDRYRRIFCSDYNIGFKLPKSDTCATCDENQILLEKFKDNASKSTEIKLQLELHQRRAEAMQTNLKEESLKSQDMNNEVISFDLQQALPIPQLTVGKAFYLRKAWMYNLGIHNCRTGDGYMYMWTENIAKRGSDDIASILYKYLSENPSPNRNLVIFTDNCGGQNKNWTIMSLWLQLVRENKFKTIEHRFLIAGHTHLPSDRDFAAIEKRKKYIQQVYSPEQWVDVVREAKQANPFHVSVLTQDDFLSFEKLTKNLNKKNATEDKEPLNFSKVRCFKFDAEHPNRMFIKHLLNEPFKAVNVGKRGLKLNQGITLTKLGKKYLEPLKLNVKKLRNLKALLPYIPSIYQKFYEEVGLECVEDQDETGDEVEVENFDEIEDIDYVESN